MTERYRHLYTASQINERIVSLAAEIIARYPVDGPVERPLFVALLRGALPFASKLMFALQQQEPRFHPELAMMRVRTYGEGQEAEIPQIITDLPAETVVENRPVIIIDDILDKGVTTHAISGHLAAQRPKTIELCVLLNKNTARHHDIEPTYAGFDVADEWIVGMGLDDAESGFEHYRWLEEIWEIKKP